MLERTVPCLCTVAYTVNLNYDKIFEEAKREAPIKAWQLSARARAQYVRLFVSQWHESTHVVKKTFPAFELKKKIDFFTDRSSSIFFHPILAILPRRGRVVDFRSYESFSKVKFLTFFATFFLFLSRESSSIFSSSISIFIFETKSRYDNDRKKKRKLLIYIFRKSIISNIKV